MAKKKYAATEEHVTSSNNEWIAQTRREAENPACDRTRAFTHNHVIGKDTGCVCVLLRLSLPVLCELIVCCHNPGRSIGNQGRVRGLQSLHHRSGRKIQGSICHERILYNVLNSKTSAQLLDHGSLGMQ